ncbi:MAG: sugar ABC transporter ATP-binding protein [Bdellovibrionales bacterium]
MSQLLVQAVKVSKSFPGVKALREVDFDLRPGEVHSLCGENGAGKSTLMKIMSGLYTGESYDGELNILGTTVSFKGPSDSFSAGIATVYQELSLVPEMTVAENIYLGREPHSSGVIAHQKLFCDSKELLDRMGLSISPNQKPSELGIGQQQLVEIAKALSHKPKILILDEPTSALSQTEIETLKRIIRQLKAEGMGIILITHKLDEIFSLSDRITVFRDGAKVGTWDASQMTPGQLVSSMVGRDIEDFYPHSERQTGEVVFEIKNWNLPHPRYKDRKMVQDVSWSVRRGEILGIAGLMGSGRTEMLMSIFGALRGQGEILVDGKKQNISSPEQAIQLGLSFATEDRKKLGLHLDFSVSENMALSSLSQFSTFGLVSSSREAETCSEFVKKMKVKTTSLKTIVKTLSGGNQQKVVLSKCLLTQPKILFLDEPTRGIDVGAKVEIYKTIHELAAQGMAVVVVSSELPELLGICDRILVLCQGRLTGEYNRGEASEEKIMTSATHFLSVTTTPVEVTA